MDAQLLKEQVIRSEGYAQGFKDGYASCAKFIADQEFRKEQEREGDKNGN